MHFMRRKSPCQLQTMRALPYHNQRKQHIQKSSGKDNTNTHDTSVHTITTNNTTKQKRSNAEVTCNHAHNEENLTSTLKT
jgi:hypothetical protein